MKFVLLFSVLVFVLAQIAFAKDEEFVCKKGVSYIENDCNSCFCADNGKLGCTLKGCLGPRTTELRRCVVGARSKNACNDCWCVKDAGTICTNKKC